MHIDHIRIVPIVLPFALAFPHALSKGLAAHNVVVEISAAGGQVVGYGEGAPRDFVTGETQASVCDTIARWASAPDFPWDVDAVDVIWRWVDGRADSRGHNAALCAVETALLDARAKVDAATLTSFFPQTASQSVVTYGAAVPLGRPAMVTRVCRVIAGMGIQRVKLKWGRDRHQNQEGIDAVKAILGPGSDIKVDVNGVWDRHSGLAHCRMIGRHGIKAVEQPLAPGDPDIGLLAEPFTSAGARLMADESVCTLAEAKQACGPQGYDMVNIRLSKCGGLRRCWQIIENCRRQGTAFQIGCQLGESGILSAAGRTLSLLCGDAVYHDGSYDAFLLKENITQNVSFGFGGKAGPLAGPGLGVHVDPRCLSRLSGPLPPLTICRP